MTTFGETSVIAENHKSFQSWFQNRIEDVGKIFDDLTKKLIVEDLGEGSSTNATLWTQKNAFHSDKSDLKICKLKIAFKKK